MRFEQYSFHPLLKENLKKLGFHKTTDIQFRVIPPAMKGEDVLAIAQTGTGKTAAFSIPIIDFLLKSDFKKPITKCLILEPTRELSVQVADVLKQMCQGSKIRVANLYGGVEYEQQIKHSSPPPHVIVATPGRLFDLMHQGMIDIAQVEILVIDEADHMLELGFLKDVQDIKRRLPRMHQTLFFSATITEAVKKPAYQLVRNAIRIQVSPENPVNRNIHHTLAFIEPDDKRFFLERLIHEQEDAGILVFVRTQVRAERVKKALERASIKSLALHGGMNQNERLEAMNAFKSGENKILIATDVSARGIDIPNVAYVVNYDMPEKPENYVHRVGRTGRGRSKGLAVSFCSQEEKEYLRQIEEYIGTPIERLKIDKGSYQETIAYSEDSSLTDWKTLMKEAENQEKPKKGKAKRK